MPPLKSKPEQISNIKTDFSTLALPLNVKQLTINQST